MEPVTGIILTGGNSSRMGTDKALLEWKGVPFLEIIISNLRPVCKHIIIVGDRPEYHHFGIPVYDDLIPNAGPLGGIYTGLKSSTTLRNFVIPSDMPFLGHEMIRNIIDSDAEKEAVIPVVDNREQPLSALYSKEITGKLEGMVNSGTRKVSFFVKSLDIHRFIVEIADKHQFLNINHRYQLLELENGDQD
jgi:molybdopterin-guanine dinucleotide biosynthesis protein A